ncbi:hypothetical protein BABINDRAFT_162068 [Babjeviella inositovora NRRL Y-12698]|uniref:MMS19 nucleotide excision repair protein n=1 Tax=Babjeviella inositovora NRRL Y-12698 TaxID=984486 RepID=A0A1E3QMS0_9ASCO|nr:uncharacterized protein BABINDRAFT_162068 [Babjeviella inositovora NRRL Y-12698]ODQ78989.1 hypothetical protein BABINDRAFT_162068 [Babjeviella inositovora NRRL Y-12698]
MSATTETLINQYLVFTDTNEQEATLVVARLADQVALKQLTLLQFIQTAGDYLTRDDDAIRSRAILCLSQMLQTLAARDATIFSKQDVSVLVDFYLSKFDDLVSHKATLLGLSCLVDFTRFASTNVAKILQTLEKEYAPKKNLAPVRYLAFDILARLLAKFGSFIARNLSAEFATTFLHVASGEKDPRNLIASFTLQEVIGAKLGITDEETNNELFDVAFCYFPISFTPPKGDPYKITSEQLKTALRGALSSNTAYAKDAFPNLIEKLTTTNAKVKLDILDTLLQCIQAYTPEAVQLFWLSLWNALKFELLHNELSMFSAEGVATDDDETRVYVRMFEIFRAMAVKLRQCLESGLQPYLTTLIEELLPNIEPEHKLFKASMLILTNVAEASPEAFNYIVEKVFVRLFEDVNDLNVPKQRNLIANMGFFLNAYANLVNALNAGEFESDFASNALLSHKDNILALLSKTLMSSSSREATLRIATIHQLVKLTSLPRFLILEETSFILQFFNEVIIADDAAQTCSAIIDGYVAISRDQHKVQLLLDTSFPVLMSLLPDSDETMSPAKSAAEILAILVKMSTNRQVLEMLCVRLLNKLEQAIDSSSSYAYLTLIVDSIAEAVFTSELESPFLTDEWLKNLVPQVNALVIRLSQSGRLPSDECYVNLLESVGKLLNLIYKYVSVEKHQQLLDELLQFGFQTPSADIALFKWSLAAIDKTALMPNSTAFAEQLIVLAHASDELTRVNYLQTLAIVVNKFTDSGFLTPLFAMLTSGVAATETREGIQSLEIIAWITKGLVLKNDKAADPFLCYILTLLETPYGVVGSRCLEIVICDLELFAKPKKLISRVVPVNTRLLYKQKFFESVVPQLVEKFGSAQEIATKKCYLIAISLLLKYVSREIILPHLTTFLPLLLQSISLIPDNEIRCASLTTISLTTNELPELVTQHLQTLVPALLDLSEAKNGNSEKVRLEALRCLLLLPNAVALTKIVPFRNSVLRRLEVAVDDKKRAVRKAACDARQAFYEIS